MKRKTAQTSSKTKNFVLDTNILINDPFALFNFKDNDIYLPMMVLEELDKLKKGHSDIARNARQASRNIETVIAKNLSENTIDEGDFCCFSLKPYNGGHATGNLHIQKNLSLPNNINLPDSPDNNILLFIQYGKSKKPQENFILVSKDINIRIKAKVLGICSEDYHNDHVIKDSDILYVGYLDLGESFWEKPDINMTTVRSNGADHTTVSFNGLSRYLKAAYPGSYFSFVNNNGRQNHCIIESIEKDSMTYRKIPDFSHEKNKVWGIKSRNTPQCYALDALINPDIDFVSLVGQAGSGKTLLALAAGLTHVLEQKTYKEIIVTRATIPVGEDIGFLPGTEEEKMNPWMGALEDNLEVLCQTDGMSDFGRSTTQDYLKSYIKVKSMAFMRGRTFVDKFVIIDECQNLTPKQMKTLVTRAGNGTKIVCLGNLEQIDAAYITETSSGLTHVVDSFKGQTNTAHVTLPHVERSRLAKLAADFL